LDTTYSSTTIQFGASIHVIKKKQKTHSISDHLIVSNTWHLLKTKGTIPVKRFLGPATAVSHRRSAYLFGGVYSAVLNNFDKLTWPTIYEILEDTNAGKLNSS
jgi:hypothetical protein